MSGPRAEALFRHEPGGHRYQRVPPNEKRGRVHTSTVTVAVMPEVSRGAVRLDPRDVRESFTRGSGKGGQHRNKTETAVVLVHEPTGLRVRIDGGRSQHINRQNALAVLVARLQQRVDGRAEARSNARRRAQLGSGMRGDKVRTIAEQRGTVTDHRTGKTISLRDYQRGLLDGLA
ncbi:MAG: PCRF domain-containing protein [Myxococcales bacterium]|nr:PCRF domain-containing protein [Myxococcales bacterium]